MLIGLKKYLRNHKRASITQLAAVFNRDPAYIRQLLSIWESKGKVTIFDPDCTTSCGGCTFKEQEYHWQE